MLILEMSRKMLETVEQKDVQMMQDMMVKFCCLKVAKVIKEFCARVSNHKMTDKTFFIEAFKTIFYLVTHYPSEQREQLADFCLTFIGVKNIVKDPEVVQFKKLLSDLYALSSYKNIFKDLLDCSYVYWFKDFIPDMLELKTNIDGEFFRL